MKKQKKPVKINSNMVCYTRGQRFRGCVAFVGLLACGVMIGWGFGSAPAKKDDVVQSSCEVQLQQFAQKQALECAEKVEAQRQQCNDMLATQAGAQEKKVNSSNDDVLIFSSDKIDLTDSKVGAEKRYRINITAKRPVRITDVHLGQNIDDLYVASTCENIAGINLERGCEIDAFYRPQVVMPMVESRPIFIDWVDENGNTGETVLGLEFSSVFDFELDCVQKEELMLEALPSQDADNYYEARAKAYEILCQYCRGQRASAYCQRKFEEARTNLDMLNSFKSQLGNKQ